MAVLGEHRALATEFEREFMIEVINLVAGRLYGADGFIIDSVMRQIPEHYHLHARPLIGRGRTPGDSEIMR
jgi:hypothetical protein